MITASIQWIFMDLSFPSEGSKWLNDSIISIGSNRFWHEVIMPKYIYFINLYHTNKMQGNE